jgi:D-sedoheptulose 7-phosphate isomerase
MTDNITRIFDENARAQKDFLKKNRDTLVTVAGILVETLKKGRKILLFGNGGSAADAQHLAAEFVNRYQADRQALAALALTTDSSVMTSIANDSGYEKVFARQIAALGRQDDAAIALSTSGLSPNVLEGVREARQQGMYTIGMAGEKGDSLARETDYCLVVPSTVTARVQEIHILAGHVLCELVEQKFIGQAP